MNLELRVALRMAVLADGRAGLNSGTSAASQRALRAQSESASQRGYRQEAACCLHGAVTDYRLQLAVKSKAGAGGDASCARFVAPVPWVDCSTG